MPLDEENFEKISFQEINDTNKDFVFSQFNQFKKDFDNLYLNSNFSIKFVVVNKKKNYVVRFDQMLSDESEIQIFLLLIEEDCNLFFGTENNVLNPLNLRIDEKKNFFQISNERSFYILINDSKLSLFFKDMVFDSDFNLNIVSQGNSRINFLSLSQYKNLNSNILSKENSNLFLNVNALLKLDSNFNFEITVDNDSKIDFKFNSVNLSKNIIVGKGVVPKNGSNSTLNMSFNSLIIKEDIEFMPFLEINNRNVKASHSVLTYGFDNNLLFYLMSKGIPKDSAKELIIKENLFRNQDRIVYELFN